MASETQFNDLPIEIVTSIFEKILDPKSLCICSSVSKYFAWLVLQIRSVSIEIPSIGEFHVLPPGVTTFLKKLYCVESATIRLEISRSEPLVWWESDGFRLLFVSAENHVVCDTADIKSATSKKFTKRQCEALFSSIDNHMRDFELRFHYIRDILGALPNLRIVSAVDTMGQGSLVLKEEGIASVRKDNPLEGLGKFRVTLWIAPILKLPSSGRVMTNVALVSTRANSREPPRLTMKNSFERELAMAVMKERYYYCTRVPPPEHGATVASVSRFPFVNSGLLVFYDSHIRRGRRLIGRRVYI